MKRILYLFLTCIIFLSACSIKKRSYRQGYYIDMAFNHKKADPSPLKKQETNSKKIIQSSPEVVTANTGNSYQPFASAENKPFEKLIQTSSIQLTGDSICEDVITFRSGKVLTAKVFEITETQVKYKRCDNIEGPLFSINKNDISSIKYPNGTVETFEPAYTPVPAPVRRPVSERSKKTHPLAWLILALTILLIIFPPTALLALLALYLIDPYAEMKIKQNPDRYKGLKLLKVCSIIRRVYVIITIVLAILLILILLSI